MQTLVSEIQRLPTHQLYGRVAGVQGLLLEVAGIERSLSIGSHCRIQARGGAEVLAEVVGFRNDRALLMPFGALDGVGLGCKAYLEEHRSFVFPDPSWLGRVVNAMGEPLDGGPPLRQGNVAFPLRGMPPPAHARQRVEGKVDLGVRALNTFLTCCHGQRMGIFAGSGVGKSVMLSMLARHTDSDVSVIGLVGERGREVQEFIKKDLGEEGLRRSIIVVATSAETALMRRQAAYLTMTLAEYFRDLDKSVLCMMDSVTRFAMAQREIGLAGGEPPASKGYTPSVFAELPKLLERAGPGTGQGYITGLFTVLVEGDDHIVLDRAIAERGRWPAVNVLRSISRTMPDCNAAEETALIVRAKQLMATYENMEELIRLGAYRVGTDAAIDEAIRHHDGLEAFLSQDKDEVARLDEGFALLAQLLDANAGSADGIGAAPGEPSDAEALP